MNTDLFAYGDSCIDGVQCPALTAGYDMDDCHTRAVAESYDEIVRQCEAELGVSADEGTIYNSDARRAWERLIEQLSELVVGSHNDYTVERLHTAALIYRNVWGDDHE